MTEKLQYLQQKKLNTADELRDRLTHLEEQLVKIKQLSQTEALEMLAEMDRVSHLVDELTAAGTNLAPEESRFDSIQRRLRKQAGGWLKAIGGPTALQQHIPEPPPTGEQWWWRIDRIVAEHRRQQRKQIGIVLAVLLFLVASVAVALKTVFAPDPAVLARVEAENQADIALAAGDYEGALAALEAGLSAVPNNPHLLLFKAVLLDILDDATAGEVMNQAQTAFTDPLAFHLAWGRLELQLSRFEQAEAQARLALTLDDESVQGWFLLGQALEGQNDRPGAVSAYEKAASLAEADEDSELLVMIRLALARLLMNPGG